MPLNIVWGDKSSNIKNLEKQMASVHPQTDLVVLPETFSTGFPVGKEKDDVRGWAERNTGETVDFLKTLSRRYQVAITGSFIADTGGSLYNRGFFIEPSGDETFADKRHLFTMAGEEKVFSKGYERLHVRFRGWNLALVICYDVRFPLWCRNSRNEYDALIVVANWPEVRVDAWNKLLPARAIENEAYVCGVNCNGTDDKGYAYGGASSVYDFKGREISVSDARSGLVYARLCREKLDGFRAKFPAWNDADPFQIIM